jgi:hypothetical protein
MSVLLFFYKRLIFLFIVLRFRLSFNDNVFIIINYLLSYSVNRLYVTFNLIFVVKSLFMFLVNSISYCFDFG